MRRRGSGTRLRRGEAAGGGGRVGGEVGPTRLRRGEAAGGGRRVRGEGGGVGVRSARPPRLRRCGGGRRTEGEREEGRGGKREG